jgi:hypothetical protein
VNHPNSTLYTDHWIPWAQAHHVPETPPASWKNQCGKHVFEAVTGTVGWSSAPRVTGPNAAAVAAASGPLNADHTAAPVGAFHFWANGPGHTAWDLNGGGEVCGMATTFPLIWQLQTFLGVQSISGYRGPFRYLGWSRNYGGGVPNSLPNPVPAVVPLTPNQREVGPRGVNLRDIPSVTGIPTLLPPGRVIEVVGFVTADVATSEGAVSSTTWFHEVDGYVWAGGMTDDGIHDLTDETPAGGITVLPVDATSVISPPDEETKDPASTSEASSIESAFAQSVLTMFSTIGTETPG